MKKMFLLLAILICLSLTFLGCSQSVDVDDVESTEDVTSTSSLETETESQIETESDTVTETESSTDETTTESTTAQPTSKAATDTTTKAKDQTQKTSSATAAAQSNSTPTTSQPAVTGGKPTGVKLNVNQITIGMGETFQLEATLEPAGSVGTIQWSPNRNGTITVSDSGLVTAQMSGTGYVTAIVYYNGSPLENANGDQITARCTITISSTGDSLYDPYKLPLNQAGIRADIRAEAESRGAIWDPSITQVPSGYPFGLHTDHDYTTPEAFRRDLLGVLNVLSDTLDGLEDVCVYVQFTDRGDGHWGIDILYR